MSGIQLIASHASWPLTLGQAQNEISNGEIGALLGGSLLFFAIVVMFYFFVQAVLLHIAASLMSLNGGFGAAIKAVLIAFLVALGFGILAGMLMPGLAQGGGILVSLIAGSIGVQTSYKCGFGKAFLTYFLSLIVTVAITAGLAFALIGAFAAGA